MAWYKANNPPTVRRAVGGLFALYISHLRRFTRFINKEKEPARTASRRRIIYFSTSDLALFSRFHNKTSGYGSPNGTGKRLKSLNNTSKSLL